MRRCAPPSRRHPASLPASVHCDRSDPLCQSTALSPPGYFPAVAPEDQKPSRSQEVPAWNPDRRKRRSQQKNSECDEAALPILSTGCSGYPRSASVFPPHLPAQRDADQTHASARIPVPPCAPESGDIRSPVPERRSSVSARNSFSAHQNLHRRSWSLRRHCQKFSSPQEVSRSPAS